MNNFYANKLDHLDEINNSLERLKLSKLTPGPQIFTDKFYKAFKEE